MTDLRAIVYQSRWALLVFAAIAVLGGLLVWALQQYGQSLQPEVAAAKAEQAQLQSTLTGKQEELALLSANMPRFEALRQAGLLGPADREGWAQTLTKVHQASGLPNTLSYSLKPPVASAPGDPSNPVAPFQTHELALSLEGIHESELLELLASYGAQVKGLFRLFQTTAGRVEPGPLIMMAGLHRPGLRALLLASLGASLGAGAQAQPTEALGTLFFNAAERRAIVQARTVPSGPPPAPTLLSLSGMVVRQGGNSTVWINGQALAEGAAPVPGASMKVAPRHITVNKLVLRPGDTLDLTNRQGVDMLPPGSVTRRPAAAAP